MGVQTWAGFKLLTIRLTQNTCAIWNSRAEILKARYILRMNAFSVDKVYVKTSVMSHEDYNNLVSCFLVNWKTFDSGILVFCCPSKHLKEDFVCLFWISKHVFSVSLTFANYVVACVNSVLTSFRMRIFSLHLLISGVCINLKQWRAETCGCTGQILLNFPIGCLRLPHRPTHCCLPTLIFGLNAHTHKEILWLPKASSPAAAHHLHALVSEPWKSYNSLNTGTNTRRGRNKLFTFQPLT